MRFDMQGAPRPNEVIAGDVYPAFGRRDQGFWAVMAVRGRIAYCIGLDERGEVVSTASYALHAFETRERVGTFDAGVFENIPVDWSAR